MNGLGSPCDQGGVLSCEEVEEHLPSVKAATWYQSMIFSLSVGVHGALYGVADAGEHWEDAGDGPGA